MFKRRKKKTNDEKWAKENLLNIDVSGKSYQEAIAIAQEHMGDFIEMFEGSELTLFKCYIKARFEDDKHIEHLWLTPISYADGTFTAIVDNDPDKLTNIKYQDVVQLKKEDVEDWIVSMPGQLFGNFIYNSSQPKQ
jgi:uncharacterized protein YegJ (DUF2314 family)